MEPSSPLTSIKGAGEALARLLGSQGIHTIGELIANYPRRYDDYSHVLPIKQLKPGAVSIRARVVQAKGRYARRGLHITEAVASDDSGSVRLTWFNQPYRAAAIKSGAEYFISGVFELSYQRLSILNPAMELASAFPVNTARIVPVYRETKGLKSAQIRKLLRECLPLVDALPENLPAWLIGDRRLIPHAVAVRAMHFPQTADQLAAAKRRLGFEEVFELNLAGLMNKAELAHDVAIEIPFRAELAREFVGHLPFKLTDDQRQVIWQIYQDLARPQPMNRLVEGDVGSGKTVVATMAALMALEQGFQVALMAPTEILASQHAETIYKMLQPLGYAGQVGLLTGRLTAKQKKLAQSRISKGDIRLMIGTHALIQEKVNIHKLGLVIVDEQHRFGVEQRKALQKKAGHALHVLSLTATPIPRSLALTLYGELDISILSARPPGRLPIITKITSPNSRSQLYAEIRRELAKGRQMFVVTPLISESEVVPAASAEAVHRALTMEFKEYNVRLMHGKLPAEDKARVMQDFVDHRTDILVSTTVIEVGVDVPNATVMLIENAERFGLAQLHQLRGRVGRSHHQGYCYLMTSDSQAPTRRLRAAASSSDGFALAELDLQLRGPGAIYGWAQHGALDLRVASLTDVKLIAEARAAARRFLDSGENLLQYPELHQAVSRLRAVTNLN